jgi:hypothetical protein
VCGRLKVACVQCGLPTTRASVPCAHTASGMGCARQRERRAGAPTTRRHCTHGRTRATAWQGRQHRWRRRRPACGKKKHTRQVCWGLRVRTCTSSWGASMEASSWPAVLGRATRGGVERRPGNKTRHRQRPPQRTSSARLPRTRAGRPSGGARAIGAAADARLTCPVGHTEWSSMRGHSPPKVHGVFVKAIMTRLYAN